MAKNKIKIAVFTATRAEYGLLFWLLKALEKDDFFELDLIISGAHLSDDYGKTIDQIEKDGFSIEHQVDLSLDDDSEEGKINSMAVGLSKLAPMLKDLNPDLLLVLGDRYELLLPVITCMMLKIPIAHMYGGESTIGAIDEAIRHSITKMSHIHFTANEEYRDRVIQMGEDPKNVHVVGSMGLENIRRTDLMTHQELEASLQFELGKEFYVITYHPVTLIDVPIEEQIKNLLNALNARPDAKFLFTGSNADPNGLIINELFKDYVEQNNERSIFVNSLGKVRYLSAIKWARGVVGNSSSGIIETSNFNTGAINIGERQTGRVKPANVVDCGYSSDEIVDALQKLNTSSFQNELSDIDNPYGDGYTSEKIIEILKGVKFDNLIIKKFKDISF